MSEILLWVHPLMQVCAAVLGVWAMWQGLKRVAMLLGKKTLFPWKQHVKLGTLALVLWILGAVSYTHLAPAPSGRRTEAKRCCLQAVPGGICSPFLSLPFFFRRGLVPEERALFPLNIRNGPEPKRGSEAVSYTHLHHRHLRPCR